MFAMKKKGQNFRFLSEAERSIMAEHHVNVGSYCSDFKKIGNRRETGGIRFGLSTDGRFGVGWFGGFILGWFGGFILGWFGGFILGWFGGFILGWLGRFIEGFIFG